MIRTFVVFFVALVFGLIGVSAIHAAPPASTFSWEVARGDSDQVILWELRPERNAWSQCGNYRISTDVYKPLLIDRDEFGEPCAPPVEVPASFKKFVENFGVSRSPVKGEHWTINGHEVSADAGREAISAPSLPNDGTLPYVVWIGDEATGVLVAQDLTKLPLGNVFPRFQSYRPDDAMIFDRDGKPVYTPGLWVVTAAGLVVGHDPQYNGPASLVEGLRRAANGFDPNKVPDLSSSPLSSDIPVEVIPLGEMVGGGLIGLGGLLFFRKVKG